jgi:tripartite-type tricarboxylate transporter receptor subunit TctC
MKQSLGQPIIIENVTGAAGSIAAGRFARARTDGYTIDYGGISTHVLNGAYYSLPYDLLKDFAPFSPLGSVPFILFASKAVRAENLNELIDWLRANPNKASGGLPGSRQRSD